MSAPPPGGAGDPTALPPDVAAMLAQGEKDGQAVVLWTVGMFCIFGWDYFMYLPQEISRIWKKSFTYISYLYLVNRYYGLLQFAIVIVLITTPITDAISVETCKSIFLWQPVGALISTFLSQCIMFARVYALYSQSRVIAGILGTIMLAEMGVHVYTMTVVFPAPIPAPGVKIPCVAIGPLPWLIAFWVMPLVFDTVTFALTLYKSISYWRTQVESPTLALLFRDGLIYFAAIFTMNFLNVILFVTQNETLQAINLPATLMLTIIMSCRLVLNMRAPRGVIRSGGGSSGGTSGNTSGSGSEGAVLPTWHAMSTMRGDKPNNSMDVQNRGPTAVIIGGNPYGHARGYSVGEPQKSGFDSRI
ncbi:hypothetical protein AX16_009081 [Volvariella volvacea WC 439]|nr:hypothetical protein AX16_009081 [Volvariella volvacea WC 439]